MSATVLPVVKRGFEPEFEADAEPDWPWRFAPDAGWRVPAGWSERCRCCEPAPAPFP